jgi:hypothetical protein
MQFISALLAATENARLSPQLRFLRDPVLLKLTAISVFLVYSAELTSFTLSIDEEVLSYNNRLPQDWVAQGRWSMGLLSWLLPPHTSIPIVATLTFCIGLTVSALIFAGCFAKSRVEAIAFALLFASCPIWPHVAEFNQLSAGFGLGLILTSVGVALTQRPGFGPAIIAGFVASVAVGIHQSLLAVFLCGAVFAIIFDDKSGPQHSGHAKPIWLSRIVWLFVSLAISVLAYVGLARLALIATQQQLTYVDNSIRIGEFLSSTDSILAINRVLRRLASLLFGPDPIFLGWGIAVLALAWFGAASSIWRSAARSVTSPGREVLFVLISLAGIVAAISPIVGSAGYAPARALGSLALVYALAGAAAMRSSALSGLPQWLMLGYAVFVNIWISTSLFYADALARQRDEVLAIAIAQRIDEVRPNIDRAIRFTMVGEWRHEIAGPALRVEVFGTSFFEHDGGNVFRVHRYFELLGIKKISPVSISAIGSKMALVDQMPSWPDRSAIAMIDDVLVIKLGPVSPPQSKILAGPSVP